MEFTSVPEILKFSISKERASVRFYRNLISKLDDATTKSLFEVMAQRELEHVAALEFEMEKLGYTVGVGKNQNDVMFRWDEHLEADEAIRDMNFIEALLLAIQKERAAFRLYTQIMATVKDEELNTVLMDLAEEEMRHVLQLEHEYEEITHHKN